MHFLGRSSVWVCVCVHKLRNGTNCNLFAFLWFPPENIVCARNAQHTPVKFCRFAYCFAFFLSHFIRQTHREINKRDAKTKAINERIQRNSFFSTNWSASIKRKQNVRKIQCTFTRLWITDQNITATEWLVYLCTHFCMFLWFGRTHAAVRNGEREKDVTQCMRLYGLLCLCLCIRKIPSNWTRARATGGFLFQV